MKNIFAEPNDSVRLTSRDLEIFRLIHSEGAQTSGELSSRFWNEKSRKAHAGFQRIRKLIDSGFLTRGNPKLLYLSHAAKILIRENQSTAGVDEVVKRD